MLNIITFRQVSRCSLTSWSSYRCTSFPSASLCPVCRFFFSFRFYVYWENRSRNGGNSNRVNAKSTTQPKFFLFIHFLPFLQATQGKQRTCCFCKCQIPNLEDVQNSNASFVTATVDRQNKALRLPNAFSTQCDKPKNDINKRVVVKNVKKKMDSQELSVV